MRLALGKSSAQSVKAPSGQLLQNLRDYSAGSTALFWQRQAIFIAAVILTAAYFDPKRALIFYFVIIGCEVQDYFIGKTVLRLQNDQRKAIRAAYVWVLVNTFLSSSAISVYAITVAGQQTVGQHFTPFFFLFAAALFAAMNNHQIVKAIVLRLSIYGLTFIYIVSKDLWQQKPPLSSELWLQFFTVIFVMYFLIDCSLVFLKLYRRNLAQLDSLKKEHELTKAAYIVKSQFISTVSHELRTPLTSIKGSLDLINSGVLGPVPEKMQRMIDMASKNGQRLANLINDVLDLQKIEAGEMKFRSDVVQVREVITEAVAGAQGLADMHKVTIEVETLGNAPVHIKADHARLIQIVSNMIGNAAKFSRDDGRVLVGCYSSAGRVRIYVKDEGIGIPEGSKDVVFDRFSQIDSSDERHVGGTGLGMNISKELVERFGGTIDYVSELGVGSTFFVEFSECDASNLEETPDLAVRPAA